MCAGGHPQLGRGGAGGGGLCGTERKAAAGRGDSTGTYGRACLGTTYLCLFDRALSLRHVSLHVCWSSACRDGKSAALQVLPVAARKALAAKISVGGTLPGGDADPARTLQMQ